MEFVTAVALLSVVTALTCALPGTFLVLRHQSMLVDAISHAVLPGIVLGAVISGSTHSPWMILMAAIMGLLVVFGAEVLRKTGLITGDANQGLIFPALFALGVIILSTTLAEVHICQDTVLTGDLNLMALTPERLVMGGRDYGPNTAWQLILVLLIGILFIWYNYPVLKLSTFDPLLAKTMGLPVQRTDLGLMLWVSVTVVVAFNSAGAILVIALMIVPPATALLLARTLPQMLAITMVIAALAALSGFYFAYVFDLATSSTMAAIDGVVFLIMFALVRMRRRMRVRYASPAA